MGCALTCFSVFKAEDQNHRYQNQRKSSVIHGTGTGLAQKQLQGPGNGKTQLYLELKRNREIATSHQFCGRTSRVSGDRVSSSSPRSAELSRLLADERGGAPPQDERLYGALQSAQQPQFKFNVTDMCIGTPAERHGHRAAHGGIACEPRRWRTTQTQPGSQSLWTELGSQGRSQHFSQFQNTSSPSLLEEYKAVRE